MTSSLTTIHMLAGFAAELNEVESKLHEALQNVVGIRAQVLYEISEASRTVDPAASVDQGAGAPGKPPRPTEGRVAVTVGLAGSMGGGDGLADLGAGVRDSGHRAVISPEADQALDGADLGEEGPTSNDPRPAPGSKIFEAVIEQYGLHGGNVGMLGRYHGLDRGDVAHILRMARCLGYPSVAMGDGIRLGRNYPVE